MNEQHAKLIEQHAKLIEQHEKFEINVKLVDGYTEEHKKQLAKIDNYKKVFFDVKEALKIRIKMYPQVIGHGIKRTFKFVLGASKASSRALLNGTIYPIRLKIDGEIDKETLIGRMFASTLVSSFYSCLLLVRSTIGKGVIVLSSSLITIYLFLESMGFIENIKESTFYIKFINEIDINIDLDLRYLLIPLVLISIILYYLGYEKSKHFEGLRVVYGSFLNNLLKIEKKKASDGDSVSLPPRVVDEGDGMG